jgi:hypothetical protein
LCVVTESENLPLSSQLWLHLSSLLSKYHLRSEPGVWSQLRATCVLRVIRVDVVISAVVQSSSDSLKGLGSVLVLMVGMERQEGAFVIRSKVVR